MSNSTSLKVSIREAVPSDMKEIHEMIKGLAVFEKMPDEVKIDAKRLEEDGFGPDPAFRCFVAEINQQLIGYALYYYCYSTWLGKSIFLEDLYVKEEYRKCGVGKELFKTVAELAKGSSGRMDFHVLKWNPAMEFYKVMGATNLTNTEDWHLLRMDTEALNKLLS